MAGFARLDAYIYVTYIRSCNKMAALGYVYVLGKQTSCSPECCTGRIAISAEFLKVQIPLRVLVCDLDLCQAVEMCKHLVGIIII